MQLPHAETSSSQVAVFNNLDLAVFGLPFGERKHLFPQILRRITGKQILDQKL